MKINLVWKAIDEPGLEFLRVSETKSEIEANGTIVKIENQKPFRANYRVRCDQEWRVREVTIDLLGENDKSVRLQSNGAGNWTDAKNNPLPALDGCLYIDISATPFTNTLPIRHLRLAAGESANIAVVYFQLPDSTFQKSEQRYTFLEETDNKAVYLFEELGVFNGFKAGITVDERGFVIDYPNLFERI